MAYTGKKIKALDAFCKGTTWTNMIFLMCFFNGGGGVLVNFDLIDGSSFPP